MAQKCPGSEVCCKAKEEAVRRPQGVEALAADLARHVGTAPPALPPTPLPAALSAVWRAVVPRCAHPRLQEVQP